MTVNAKNLARSLRKIYPKGVVSSITEMPDVAPEDDLIRYKHDPVGFARDVLGINLTDDQRRIISALPGRVKVNSGHGLGKTLMAAVATLWWFHTRNPGIIVTTGPTKHHVDTVLWTEIRMLAMRAARKLPSQFLPKASKIYDHPDHWAEGVTAATGEGFQGRHRPSMFFIFDECHDDQTEVLTEYGWKKFEELTGREALLTMDQQTEVAEYVVPDRLVKRWHDGDLYAYKTNGVDFRVTPGHVMLWRRQHQLKSGTTVRGPWQRSRMDDLAQKSSPVYMTRTVKWVAADQDRFTLPAVQTDRKAFGDRSFVMDDWVQFLAWYFSEGHLVKAANGHVYGVGISQKDQTTVDEIAVLCERLGFEPRVYKPSTVSQVMVNDMQVSRWLAQFGATALTKHLPGFLRHLSSRQIGLFLDVYVRGDGYQQRDNQQVLYTSSPRMASDLQELIIKTGCDSNLNTRPLRGRVTDFGTHTATSTADGYVVSRLNWSKQIRFDPNRVEKTPYSGYVYCATLPKHQLLLTRRNGKVLWSSNCEDIDPIYWQVTDTMYQADQDHAWFVIGNPITTSSQSFLEDLAQAPDGSAKWKLFTLSGLNHPNIAAQLQGLAPPIPHAVSLAQVRQWFLDWTTPVMAADKADGDVEWPPGSGVWYRPGPTFKARVMGVRPTEGVDTVWSMTAWERMLRPAIDPRQCWEERQGVTIGVDPAAYGDDFTTFHVRTGGLSLYHESRNGWGPERVAGRLKELCREWAVTYNSWASTDRPPIKAGDVKAVIEMDGGLGVAVMSHRGDGAYWNWRGVTVGAASSALDPGGGKLYGNVRAQMWLEGARLAAAGGMDVSRLPPEVQGRLRVQLLAPYYEVRPDGSRLVESKADVKERLGRSPDDADALLVSHYKAPSNAPSLVLADTNPW